jgi:hypothetical protein
MMHMTTKRRDTRLSRAYAYWRLAAKAERAGNDRQAESYRGIADRSYQEYQRQKQHLARQFPA